MIVDMDFPEFIFLGSSVNKGKGRARAFMAWPLLIRSRRRALLAFLHSGHVAGHNLQGLLVLVLGAELHDLGIFLVER